MLNFMRDLFLSHQSSSFKNGSTEQSGIQSLSTYKMDYLNQSKCPGHMLILFALASLLPHDLVHISSQH